MTIQFVPGRLDRELPDDFYLLLAALFDNRRDFFIQLLDGRDPPV